MRQAPGLSASGAPGGMPAIHACLREASRAAVLSPEHEQACDKLDVVVMHQDAEDDRRFAAKHDDGERRIIEPLSPKELLSKG